MCGSSDRFFQNPVKTPGFEEGGAQYNFAIMSAFYGSHVAMKVKGISQLSAGKASDLKQNVINR